MVGGVEVSGVGVSGIGFMGQAKTRDCANVCEGFDLPVARAGSTIGVERRGGRGLHEVSAVWTGDAGEQAEPP